jgi:ferredoxin
MADKKNRFKENIRGKYYVDDTCIACDACVTAAPENFLMNDDEGHAFVTRQPANDKEVTQCQEAIEGCPVESIGDDGE